MDTYDADVFGGDDAPYDNLPRDAFSDPAPTVSTSDIPTQFQFGTPGRFTTGSGFQLDSPAWPTPLRNLDSIPYFPSQGESSDGMQGTNLFGHGGLAQYEQAGIGFESELATLGAGIGTGESPRSVAMTRTRTAPLSYSTPTYDPSALEGPLSAGLAGVFPDGGAVASTSTLHSFHPSQPANAGPSTAKRLARNANHGFQLQEYAPVQLLIYGRPVVNGVTQETGDWMPFPDERHIVTLGRGKKNTRNVSDMSQTEFQQRLGTRRDSTADTTLEQTTIGLDSPEGGRSSFRLSPSTQGLSNQFNIKNKLRLKVNVPPLPGVSPRTLGTFKSTPQLSGESPAFPVNPFLPMDLSVPSNTPLHTGIDPAHHQVSETSANMPFTFGELARHGLAVDEPGSLDSADVNSYPIDTQVRVSVDFFGSEDGHAAPLTGASFNVGDMDLNFLGLPTPALANGSGLSTPATAFGEHSPMLDGSPTLSPSQLEALFPGWSTGVKAWANSVTNDDFRSLGVDPTMVAPGHVDLMAGSQFDAQCHLPFSDASNFAPRQGNAQQATFGSENIEVVSPLGIVMPMQAAGGMPLPDPSTLSIPTQPVLMLGRKRSRIATNEGSTAEDRAKNNTDGLLAGVRKNRTLPTGSRLKPGPKPRTAKVQHPPPTGPIVPSLGTSLVIPPRSPLDAGDLRVFPSLGEGTSAQSQEFVVQGESGVPKDLIRGLYEPVYEAPPDNPNGRPAKRYVCKVEGCERNFPRKTAIESHIQTHLEDKPFMCTAIDCNAAFVRQHDLRRHERIHSGNKPFTCECGKGFARGDALMRHRQRGICIGSTIPRRC